MFAGIFLVLNAFWLSLTWPDLLIVPVVTLLQMALVLPLIIAISFVPNPFLKPTDSEDQISSR